MVEKATIVSAEIVATAHRNWGKGAHPAGLNFGDCFAYSLAAERKCPLLFVGNDFAKTDVKPAFGQQRPQEQGSVCKGEKRCNWFARQEVGESAEATACVWSRAPKIVDVFDRGVVIRSARGLFLAIPKIPTSIRMNSGRGS